MTVATLTRKTAPMVGDGVNTSWDFSFKVNGASDIRLVKANTDTGVETNIPVGDFDVALNPTLEGGVVLYPKPGSVIAKVASNETIVVYREVEQTQDVAIKKVASWDSIVIERELDRLTMRDQELQEQVDRSLSASISSTLTFDEYIATVQDAANYASDTKGDIEVIQDDITDKYDYIQSVAPIVEVIQDYTTVGAVGSVGQQFAGRDYTLAELQARFGASRVKAYYRFGAGVMTTDETGSYTLTEVGTAPTNTTGIVGTNFAATTAAAGNYKQASLLSDVTSVYSGAGNGVVIGGWFRFLDGNPSSVYNLFSKRKDGTSAYEIYLGTNGVVIYSITISSVNRSLSSMGYIPDGQTGWYLIMFEHSTTNGLIGSVNGVVEAMRNEAADKVLMANDAVTDFRLMASYLDAGRLNGQCANFFVLNTVLTQADRDFLYATSISLPVSLQTSTPEIRGDYKLRGADSNVRQFSPQIINKETTRILIKGGSFENASHKVKLTGRI